MTVRSIRKVTLLVISTTAGLGTDEDPCRLVVTIANDARPEESFTLDQRRGDPMGAGYILDRVLGVVGGAI